MSVTPPRVNRVPVCPSAPVRPADQNNFRVRIAERKEAARQMMMITAAAQLTYMKNMKAIIEATPSTDDTSSTKSDTIAFFDSKIEALELDAAGKPRYIYTLNIRDDNGDEVTHDVKEFTTSQKVYEYITEMAENYEYDEEPYTIPSANEMDSIMDTRTCGKDIVTFGDDDGSGNCIVFYLKRRQVNF
jgi:hypothetical protein